VIFQLTVISGPKEGELSIGEDQRKTIGRSPKADWSFPEDGHMSSLHCEVINHATYVELVDRNSLNKTWLNNKEIDAPVKLKHGDRIRAGTTIFLANIQHSHLPPPVVPVPPRSAGERDQIPEVQPDPKPPESPGQPPPVEPEKDPYLTVVPEDDLPLAVDTDVEAPPVITKPVAALPNTQPMEAVPTGSPSKRAIADPPSSGGPIVDSGISKPSVVANDDPAPVAVKFRRLEKHKLTEAATALRSIVDALMRQRSLKFIVHFLKIGATTPSELKDVKPVYPSFPGASTHLPVILSHAHWLSPSVQDVLGQLILNDGLLILISSSEEQLDQLIDEVSATGITGFSEEGGFFGWCWPSAVLSIVENLGVDQWSKLFRRSIDGMLLFPPKSSSTLIAYANDDLASRLLKYGFSDAGK
jgi:FHA domain